MAFELRILLQSCLVPVGVSMAMLIIAWLCEPRLQGSQNASPNKHPSCDPLDSSSSSLLAAIVGFGWWLATIASVSLLDKWEWISKSNPWVDPWMLVIWPMLLGALVLGPASICCFSRPWRFLASASLTLGSFWLILPAGPAWKDLVNEQSFWMCVGSLSVLWNAYSTEKIHESGGARWSLWILVASLGAVFAMAIQSYATMAQVVLAITSATGMVALFALLRPTNWLRSVIWSASLCVAVFTAWARFRNYSPLPTYIYLLALFTPSLIGGIDSLLAHWQAKKLRPFTAFLLALASLATIIAMSLPAEEQW